MTQYNDLIDKIAKFGNVRADRTGTGTVSLFGPQITHQMRHGFPIPTGRKIHYGAAIKETLWMLTGSTDNKKLNDMGVTIWDEWQNDQVESDDNFDKREIVYVEPRIKPQSAYYNPDSSGVSFPNGSVEDMLRGQWSKMMDRCYNVEAHNYKYYGGRGVFVDERWHVLQNFIDDVKLLPNWQHKLADWNNYNLDKDYYSSNCYSKETCLWLSKKENGIYGSTNNAVLVLLPNGQANLFISISQCAEEMELSKSSVHRFTKKMPEVLKGENKKLQGVKFAILNEPFRFAIPKIGDLGPIYGDQWRNWGPGTITKQGVLEIVKNSRDDEAQMFTDLARLFKNKGIHHRTVKERLHIAEDMVEFGVSEKFTKEDVDHLNELYAKYAGVPDALKGIGNTLTEWGIAEEVSYRDSHDQIQAVIDSLRKKPFSRRHIVSAWNVAALPDETKSPKQNVLEGRMSLAPCHALFQFYVEEREITDMMQDLDEKIAEEFLAYAASLPNGHALIMPGRTHEQIRDADYWIAQFNGSEDKEKLVHWLRTMGVKSRSLSLKLYQR